MAKPSRPPRKAPRTRTEPTAGATSAASPAAKQLSVTVQYASGAEGLPSRVQLRRWVRAASAAASATITLRLVDADEGRSLNRAYRGKDCATDVLSFPYAPPPRLSGDLVLCVPVVQREADAQGKPVGEHFAHLVVHGMLHLQGYDHHTDAQAKLMEATERAILARLGIADPY